MLDASIYSLTTLARNWWALMLRGVIAVMFGLIAWFWPGLALNTLILLFAAYALAGGLLGIVAAVRSIEANLRWIPLLAEGVISVAAGLIALVWPGLAAKTFLYVIAIWAILSGVLEIAAAIRLRKEISNEWLLGLSGVAGIVFGVVAIARPLSGALAVLWLIGLASIFIGALLIALGWRLRNLRPSLEAASRQRAAEMRREPDTAPASATSAAGGREAAAAGAAGAGLLAAGATSPDGGTGAMPAPASGEMSVGQFVRGEVSPEHATVEPTLSTEGEGEGVAEAEQAFSAEATEIEGSTATTFDAVEHPSVLDDESEQELFRSSQPATEQQRTASGAEADVEREEAVREDEQLAAYDVGAGPSASVAEEVVDIEPEASGAGAESGAMAPEGEATGDLGMDLVSEEPDALESVAPEDDSAAEVSTALADLSTGESQGFEAAEIAEEADIVPSTAGEEITAEMLASAQPVEPGSADVEIHAGEALEPPVEGAEAGRIEEAAAAAAAGEAEMLGEEAAQQLSGAPGGEAEAVSEPVSAVGAEASVQPEEQAERWRKDTTGLSRSEREFEELIATLPPEGSGWRRGDGTQVMPEGYPIKGNASSRIYHMPGGRSYDATIPEIWFAQAGDARAAGFRPRSGDPEELDITAIGEDAVESEPTVADAALAVSEAQSLIAEPGVVTEPEPSVEPEQISQPESMEAAEGIFDLEAEAAVERTDMEEAAPEEAQRPARMTIEEQRLARLLASLPPEGSGWVRGDGTATCPPEYSIKGNATSRIYHVIGGQSYDDTVPEICFATPDDAAAAGFRARKGDPPFSPPAEIVTGSAAPAGQAGEEKHGQLVADPAIAAILERLPVVGAGWVHGDGTANCPDGYPIKGNADSMLYHLPDRGSYRQTIPEFCFATESDAENAGFRAAGSR